MIYARAILFIKMHTAVTLFVLIFSIYLTSFNPNLESGDTLPASLLPFSILEYHNLYLDHFTSCFQDIKPFPWMVKEIGGHYLSSYPIVTPTLITSIYIIPYMLLKLFSYPIDMMNPGFQLIVVVLEKVSASMIAALSAAFVFLSLNRLVNKNAAIVTTLIYALATNTWAVSSQELWQHGSVELLLASMIYLILLNENAFSYKYIIISGILSGLFLFNRPSDCILLLPIIFYMIYTKKLTYYIPSLLIASIPYLYYNLYYFNNIFGGYNSLISEFGATNNSLGLLISPNRGLLIYSPITILSLFGYFSIGKNIKNSKLKYVLLSYGLAVIMQILAYGQFAVWWGGGSYGPRFLIGLLPVLSIYIGIYIDKFIRPEVSQQKRMLFASLLIMLLLWSIFAQIVGAFYYPNGNWNGYPKNVDMYPERLWYLNDTQIIRTFNAGPAIENPLKIIHKAYLYTNGINSSFKKTTSITEISLSKNWYESEFWNDIPTQ